MWTDLDIQVEADRRINEKLRQAELWRLHKSLKASAGESGLSLTNLLSPIAARLREWLSAPPEPQEECC